MAPCEELELEEIPDLGWYIVSVAGRRFSVPDEDIALLRSRLADAARSGGAFVGFDVGKQAVEVLVSPGVPIFIERIADPEQDDTSEVAAGASLAQAVVAATDDFDEWGI